MIFVLGQKVFHQARAKTIEICNKYIYQYLSRNTQRKFGRPQRFAYNPFLLFSGVRETNQEAAFREWFGHIVEIRSLCLKVPCFALTSTTCPNHRRKIMTKLCFGKNACVISDIPDRKNIKMSVIKVKQNEDPDVIFHGLFNNLIHSQFQSEVMDFHFQPYYRRYKHVK